MTTQSGFVIFTNDVVITVLETDTLLFLYRESNGMACTSGDSLKLWSTFVIDLQNMLSIGLSMTWIISPAVNFIEIL